MGEIFTNDQNAPHIAVCPSAGMAHLLPYLRVSSMLASSNCRVTLMTVQPTLSTAESTQINNFLASHPHIHRLDAHLPPPDTLSSGPPALDNNASITKDPSAAPDPFFIRYSAVSNNSRILARNLIGLSPAPTAILCDIMFVSGFQQTLSIPIYVFPITSTRFFSFATYFSHLGDKKITDLAGHEIVIGPGMAPIAKSSIPPPFYNPNHIFAKLIATNSSWLHKCKGIVTYSFDYLERETLSSLRDHNALGYLPPVFTIGPLKPLYDDEKTTKSGEEEEDEHRMSYLGWLDEQPAKSVVYVNFGSRTAMTKEQIRELGDGLEMSGVKFLWVVKTMVVDNEEKDDLKDVLGATFLEKVNSQDKGVILKQWVDQDRVLVHPAVGGFLTHCGWNSITEASKCGVPLLGWPLHGDQRVNAEVVESSGLGVWAREWGWIQERLVPKEEIAKMVEEVMRSEGLRESARRVGEEATKAWESEEGSSRVNFAKFIQEISHYDNN
ncbi:hypothetical protein vseg_005864 [Gypsophila vaccaria]